MSADRYISIIDIKPSNVKGKRLCATLSNGKKYNFGLDTSSTYVDHHDVDKRTAYRKRHYGSMREKPLMGNLTPSNSVLSYYLLWGPSVSLSDNIQYLNRLWIKRRATG